MERMLARVQELEFAKDDPIHIWDRLARFWKQAETEEKPLVSEILRQARDMPRILELLMVRLRRVLQRERDIVGLDRVQEIDEASMSWLSRQPGRTLTEQAGPSQLVQAIVRRESYDTGENRVVHAWCRLANGSARDWMRHNDRAQKSERYRQVKRLYSRTRVAIRDLEKLRIGIAPVDQIPNFVLTDDLDYRKVNEAWRRLLREKRRFDELWAWQSRTWSDFCALAVTLSVKAIDGAELVASCPLKIFHDHDRGARFSADTPLAVYYLREQGLIIEVQYRPQHVGCGQDSLCAPIWLRIPKLGV
jgi:hypothetical protein